ncbi:MAG: RNA methyltransferase [Bacteroidales bacterium]|nr:RNA methyltransferase [Bacteroidales bacterium]
MRIEAVTSLQNPKIKELLALQEKSGLRREKALFVVEGVRETRHCLDSGFEPDTIFVCPSILGRADAAAAEWIYGSRARIVEITPEIYARVAYRGGTEGVMAEMKWKERRLDTLTLKPSPLIAVLEGVEKPGNLGAVLRSADAAGADAVLICDSPTDLYNPNLIRASIGAVFTVPTVCCTSEEATAFLKERGVRILTAQLQDSELYYDADMKSGTAIVIGNEASGLTDIWRDAADAHVRIPMLGNLDSLNASVSAAILLFEAVRQRL